MNKRLYFLKKRRHGRTPERHMRQKVISKYHLILSGYRRLILPKQIMALMVKTHQDEVHLTQSETSSILEGERSLEPRTKNDLEALNSAMYRFRKYMQSKGFPLVVYPQRQYLQEVDGRDWVYILMVEKAIYKPVNKHMGRVSTGVIDIDGRNQNVLRMTIKQIQRILQDILEELDLEAAGLKEDKDSK